MLAPQDQNAPTGKKRSAAAKSKVAAQYQKKTHLEHIKERPDTYIGSCEGRCEASWVYSTEKERMEYRDVTFVPGLYKIFDEILVNAADNKMRDDTMKYIKVNIDRESGEISVENDGKGIPIEMHEKEGMLLLLLLLLFLFFFHGFSSVVFFVCSPLLFSLAVV